MEPSVLEHFVGRRLIAVVAAHQVGTAGHYLADRFAVGRASSLISTPLSGLPTEPASSGSSGCAAHQHWRRLGQPVAFEQPDADVIEKLGDALRQRGAAADGELEPAAERRMRLAKQDRAEVEPEVVLEAPIEVAQLSNAA